MRIEKDHVKSIPILDVVGALGISLNKFNQGPCPTGHDSRGGVCFAINERENYFHCFSCKEAGDVIRLVEITKGVDFKDALTWLQELDGSSTDTYRPTPPAAMPTPQEPKSRLCDTEPWQKIMERFITYSFDQLWKHPDQLAWYENERGLNRESISEFMLGYNPQQRKIKGISFLSGPVMPYLPMKPYRIARARVRIGPGNYPLLKGSDGSIPFIIDTGAPAWMIVESELDGMLLKQEAGDLVSVCALGTVNEEPQGLIKRELKQSPLMLISLDNDQPGRKAAAWWLNEFPNARHWPTVRGKDPCDMHVKGGLHIRKWVELALKHNQVKGGK